MVTDHSNAFSKNKHNHMIIATALPLQSLFFKHWHTDDQEVGVIVSKARFLRTDSGAFRPTGAAPPLQTCDVFEGDPATGYLLHEQDIAPAKAATDLIIHGQARSPDAQALADWSVSVSIADKLSYEFHVRGPCQWERRLGRWRLSPPNPITTLPLHYGLSYGGTAPGDDPEVPEIYEYNPAGIGYVTEKRRALKNSFAAPQIGLLAEFMAPDIYSDMTVCGTGPLAKAWLPRRSNAGTFDEDWQRVRHPRMPNDYSSRFWNCAPAELQISPYLKGHEIIKLTGFSHDIAPLRLQLPGAGLHVSLSGDSSTDLPMVLDTVTIDVAAADPAKHTIDMVWRALIRDPGAYHKARIIGQRNA